MNINPANPVIVQGDGKVLLETRHPRFDEARDFLSRFAELEASPDLLHTYRITSLSLWNAASAGMVREEIVAGLRTMSKFDIPADVLRNVDDTISRYGLVQLQPHPIDPSEWIRVGFKTAYIEKMVRKTRTAQDIMVPDGRRYWRIPAGMRGIFKQRMLLEKWPVEDLAGFLPGDPLAFRLREVTLKGKKFLPRDYQNDAVERWFMAGSPAGGHGVVVLPCGAGKTIVAMQAMEIVQQHALILCNNQTAVNQWVEELADKTWLRRDQVGSYTGREKKIRPVTVATYQVLTWRRSRDSDFEHLHLFRDHNWGLLIYDEVHLLPAPVFGATAELQGRRRLGLTATLVREDGREGDVFSLVGPKRYDVPWQVLEKQGWVAEALCFEVRVPFTRKARDRYERAGKMEQHRLAAENPRKLDVVLDLIERHEDDNILVIGTYLNQLHTIADALDAPLITGETPQRERDVLFREFREGTIKRLVVSKVANFAIDLPDANVAIQVSGSFGSRQEEAQRLGRILRPKDHHAHFYTVVTTDSKEQEFAIKRQLFLTEQGYRYHIEERAAK
ncbi:MAG: DEAD/DEAH box helicase [Deltaproteobacteria bacterium]|nr:DEAD/DEAH box helicase [Deltaproteobacteria bacterium]MBW2252998.1 DEAD/DEAH box helicase [Deltaproteobacteria bacterium]